MKQAHSSLISIGRGRRTPPSFEEAASHREKVRAAGLNPNYWYPVEWEKNVARGQVIEVKFWGRSIAVYRGDDGALRALENRCAHRQVKLTLGHVVGCNLACMYHGWKYDPSGRCVDIPHELFGHKMPKIAIDAFPLEVRYGLIWIFPGDPALASQRELPQIPEIDDASCWGVTQVDYTWKTHHSTIMDNVGDFSHTYLHLRKRNRPFACPKLTHLQSEGDTVSVAYERQGLAVGASRLSRMFVDRERTRNDTIRLAYQYPYQWSDAAGKFKNWSFMLPIDQGTTRVFFILYFSQAALRLPIVPLQLPNWLLHVLMPVVRELVFKRTLAEDGVAIEAEYQGYNDHFEKPTYELNPICREFHSLTIRKWDEYLQSASPREREAYAGASAAAAPPR